MTKHRVEQPHIVDVSSVCPPLMSAKMSATSTFQFIPFCKIPNIDQSRHSQITCKKWYIC